MKNKMTVETALEHEKEALIEALGYCIELSNEFIERYASEDVRDLLLSIPEYQRADAIEDAIDPDKSEWVGFYYSPESSILLNIYEIEVQFEGEPEDYFEKPDDWHIDGDLAYTTTGLGLAVHIDKAAIEAYKAKLETVES